MKLHRSAFMDNSFRTVSSVRFFWILVVNQMSILHFQKLFFYNERKKGSVSYA